MIMKNISYCLLAGLIFGSCSGKVYEQTDNGVIVKVQQKGEQNARLVRFQVMGDKLIHVSATPDSKFADSKSLIIVPQEKQNTVYRFSTGRYYHCFYKRGQGFCLEFYR